MIFGILAMVVFVGAFTFYNHHLFDWLAQQRRQFKSVRAHAQRLVDRNRGVDGAVREVTERLAATDLSVNNRKHLENVLRRIRKGDLEPQMGEVKPARAVADQA